MKILFMDVDGVLNCENTPDRCGIYIGIEDDKVELLKQIIDATDAKIVLSSTWRLGFNNKGHRLEHHAEYLKDKLARYGLEIYDKTKDLSRHGELRGKEINEWLSRHPEVEQWVVLDDEWFTDFNMYDIGKHLVSTWFYTVREKGGLTKGSVEEAIRILQGEFEDE